MVNYCRVLGCHNRSDGENDRSFYRLPEVIHNQCEKTLKLSSERRRRWISSLKQDFTGKNLKNIRVCSDHFVSKKRVELFEEDNPDWVPSVNMGVKRVVSITSPDVASDKYKRRKDRHKKTDAAQSLILLHGTRGDTQTALADTCEQVKTASLFTDTSLQTDVNEDLMCAMQNELQMLRNENITLKQRLSSSLCFSIDSFNGNDDKVKFFTGLTCFQTLVNLFKYLEPYLPRNSSVGSFECLILTLARFRLNLSVNHLAYQLNTNVSTISRIISSVTDIMYIQMKPFVLWPERGELRKTMPMQFRRQFGLSCVVIIDCFEVLIERPSNFKARAETWSSNKHHNTVKFLLGITPQGVISFISRSWGGRASDKHIPYFGIFSPVFIIRLFRHPDEVAKI